MKQTEETRCTCDRQRSELPSVPVEVEAHNKITTDPLHNVRNVESNFDLPKTTVLKILCTVVRKFNLQYQMLQPGDGQRIFWTNETHCSLIENLNSKNCVH